MSLTKISYFFQTKDTKNRLLKSNMEQPGLFSEDKVVKEAMESHTAKTDSRNWNKTSKSIGALTNAVSSFKRGQGSQQRAKKRMNQPAKPKSKPNTPIFNRTYTDLINWADLNQYKLSEFNLK